MIIKDFGGVQRRVVKFGVGEVNMKIIVMKGCIMYKMMYNFWLIILCGFVIIFVLWGIIGSSGVDKLF